MQGLKSGLSWWKEIMKEFGIAGITTASFEVVKDGLKKEATKRMKNRESIEAQVMNAIFDVESYNPTASQRLLRRHADRQQQREKSYGDEKPYGPLEEDDMIDALGNIYKTFSEVPGGYQIVLKIYERLGVITDDEEFDMALEIMDNDNIERILKTLRSKTQEYGNELGIRLNSFAQQHSRERTPWYLRFLRTRRG